jgi:hypothetical protein
MKRKGNANRLVFFTILLVCLNINSAVAQINIPKTSPKATVSQVVGISNASITYSRPAVNGRRIFGDLVPYNVVWRTGANFCTTLQLDADMYINGNLVKSGKYGLYSIPNREEWTIILNQDNSQFGSFNYDIKKDIVRFNVRPVALRNTAEQLEFKFEQINSTAVFICLEFEKIGIKFKIEEFPDEKIMAEIKQKTESSDATIETLVRAAEYYYDQNRNLSQALTWAMKVIEADKGHFAHHLVAKIAAKMGDCKTAVTYSEKSLELATKAGDVAFVKLNNLILEQCKKK